jgi:molybdopterin molybdotransferase
MTHDRTESGFKDRTRVAEARERLLERVVPHGRTERLPLTEADGRVLASAVTAPRAVPGYDRAAMDGWAVRARDTFGASDRSPAVLRAVETEDDDTRPPVGPQEAVRVHTGSELPSGADAVVKIERTERVGPDVEIDDAVAEGENVGDRGEDVNEGQHLYDAGHRLRPSDLGLLQSVGVDSVEVREPPTVSVIPTGEELVESDPDPGEIIETNGLTVSRLVERWGGDATYRDIVTDDPDALREAIQRDTDHDIVVTTGGSSVGERDLVPEVVSELGEVFVHGVALKPGHPVALGTAGDTPVLMLPGYPVACLVNAVQFLRSATRRAGGLPSAPLPTERATLARKVASEPGERTFVRVRLDRSSETDDATSGDDTERGEATSAGRGEATSAGRSEATSAGRGEAASGDAGTTDSSSSSGLPTAAPTRASGAGVLSSVALSDGWVVVPEPREGIDAGETVSVELWEGSS